MNATQGVGSTHSDHVGMPRQWAVGQAMIPDCGFGNLESDRPAPTSLISLPCAEAIWIRLRLATYFLGTRRQVTAQSDQQKDFEPCKIIFAQCKPLHASHPEN